MSGIIGPAADFYRLRIARIEEPEGLDFEWRDDILYREPPPAHLSENEVWILEIIELDNEDAVRVAGRFETRDAAQEVLAAAEEDLAELTRSKFEERYLG